MFTSGTEMTTAVTDLINGIVCIILLLQLRKQRPHMIRTDLWSVTFILFTLVSLVGVIPHGFMISRSAYTLVWTILYVLMAFMMSAFTAAVRFEVYGSEGLRRSLTVSACIAVTAGIVLAVLFRTTAIGFMAFSIFCGLNILYIIVLLIKHRRERKCHSLFLLAALVITAATVLQTVKSIRFTLIWDFNYNAVYHFFLLLGMLVLYRGVESAQES